MTERTSLFLMANLGPEVSRIFSAKEKNNQSLLAAAITRAKLILNELKSLPDTKDNAEIDILSDIINDFADGEKRYQIPREQLQSYFYPFTMKITQNLT